MSIITTGINIVATGVGGAISQVKAFGREISATGKQVKAFSNGYESSVKTVEKSANNLKSALSQDWSGAYQQIVTSARKGNRDIARDLKSLEKTYDRTFREIGNKYQSMVMGSVALSMSGIGIKNTGMGMLGGLKTSLDAARDFELVMQQIQFYGKKTAQEMEKVKSEIFQIGYDLPVTTGDVANAVLGAQKLGYGQIKDAMAMATESSKINFMSLGKLDGEESLKFISQLRKQMGYAIGDTDQLTDKLAKTADVSASSIDSLWKTFQSSRTAFSSLRTNDDNFLTLMGVMSDRLTPKNAGMALGSFGGGVQMAEKAGRENRGTRGEYYNQLLGAMGVGGYDDYKGDVIKYVQDVATKSKEIWGEGSKRSGNLQSIFGKSAVDLFYAVDQYAKDSGRSMVEMRNEISNADGHAKKLIDTLMNGSYGTEMRLEAMVEQFHILFGTAIRPMFNAILDGLTFLLTKVNKFIEAHPKIAKVLGYGFGLAGLLTVATGAAMIFAGGLLAIYASLANLFVQLARHNRVLGFLSKGYGSAGSMIAANFLAPLRGVGKSLLKLSGISFFLYMAWKNDFLKMRTNIKDWVDYVQEGFGRADELITLFNQGKRGQLNNAFFESMERGMDFDKLGMKLAKFYMVFKGVQDMWGDNKLSSKNEGMLDDAGLLETVKTLNQWKNNVISFWNGFEKGMKEGFEFLTEILEPIKPIWEWLNEKTRELLQTFGFFKTEAGDASNKFEEWGVKLGQALGFILAIKVGLWAWTKLFTTLWAPVKLLLKGFSKMGSLIKNMKGHFSSLGTLIKNMGKNLAKFILPKPLANLLRGIKNTAMLKHWSKNKVGTHTPIPNAKQNVGPNKVPTGQVTYLGGSPQASNKTAGGPLTKAQQKKFSQQGAGTLLMGGNPTQSNGKNTKVKGQGLRGRMKDLWLGQQYLPETTKNGRKMVRTDKGGATFTDAQGRVKGKEVRTGGLRDRLPQGMQNSLDRRQQRKDKAKRTRATMNRLNFMDAGMDYDSSVGQKGHRRRSIGAAVKGSVHRSRNLGAQAGGGGFSSRVKSMMGSGGGKDMGGAKAGQQMAKSMSKGITAKAVFANVTKGIGGLGSKVGTGLMTGLKAVVTKGIPAAFNLGLRAFSFVGWALLAWDAVKLIWSNWDSIKNAGVTAWNWIKTTAITAWNNIKTWAVTTFESWKAKGSELWNTIASYAATKWNEIKAYAASKIEELKSTVSGIWDNLVSGFMSKWNTVKAYATNNPITQTIKQVTQKVGGYVGGIGGIGFPKKRLGDWNTKENGMYQLHQGEMVLRRNQAQILRGLAGNNPNNVTRALLDSTKKSSTKLSLKSSGGTGGEGASVVKGGDTHLNFSDGAIQVHLASGSPNEAKQAANEVMRQMKRKAELDNMKNYRKLKQ